MKMPFIQKTLFADNKEKIIPFLCEKLQLDTDEAKRLIDKQRVRAEGKPILKKSQIIQGEIRITLFEHSEIKNTPFFTHKEFAVFDKPSGLLVHPKKISSEHSLLDDVKSSFGNSANIVHRIDRETSGLVLTSRNKTSEKFFKLAFDDKKIEKSYFAYVKGKLEKRCEINTPILKFRGLSARLNPISDEGRASKTIIEPITYISTLDITLVRAIPITGRTHQIRIHLWHIGHPIVGEPLYGNDKDFRDAYLEKTLNIKQRIQITGAKRLLLHANELKFRYASTFHIFSKSDFCKKEFLISQIYN